MNLPEIHKDDVIYIGEPPAVEAYIVLTEPDKGRFCQVAKIPTYVGQAPITVYLGRWATLGGKI